MFDIVANPLCDVSPSDDRQLQSGRRALAGIPNVPKTTRERGKRKEGLPLRTFRIKGSIEESQTTGKKFKKLYTCCVYVQYVRKQACFQAPCILGFKPHKQTKTTKSN